MDHHSTCGGQAVGQDDRRARAERLAADRRARPLELERRRLARAVGAGAQWTVTESISTGWSGSPPAAPSDGSTRLAILFTVAMPELTLPISAY
ncbi:MAG: hypothetical protein QOJ01_1794 [Solirubrobacterales bacterium]|jgi:hypothetical protein|nr:hypothetical protein [Solirubrobacterales bacterium]